MQGIIKRALEHAGTLPHSSLQEQVAGGLQDLYCLIMSHTGQHSSAPDHSLPVASTSPAQAAAPSTHAATSTATGQKQPASASTIPPSAKKQVNKRARMDSSADGVVEPPSAVTSTPTGLSNDDPGLQQDASASAPSTALSTPSAKVQDSTQVGPASCQESRRKDVICSAKHPRSNMWHWMAIAGLCWSGTSVRVTRETGCGACRCHRPHTPGQQLPQGQKQPLQAARPGRLSHRPAVGARQSKAWVGWVLAGHELHLCPAPAQGPVPITSLTRPLHHFPPLRPHQVQPCPHALAPPRLGSSHRQPRLQQSSTRPLQAFSQPGFREVQYWASCWAKWAGPGAACSQEVVA